jgi:hypothetical protein
MNCRVCGFPPAADESATGLEIAATYFATLPVTLHAPPPVGSQMIPADPLVHGRAWCGTHRGGVFRSDDGGRSWKLVGLSGRLIMAVTASPAERDVVWVGPERSVALSGRWNYVGADQPIGDIVLVVGVVLSAETGHSSCSLDRVPST